MLIPAAATAVDGVLLPVPITARVLLKTLAAMVAAAQFASAASPFLTAYTGH